MEIPYNDINILVDHIEDPNKDYGIKPAAERVKKFLDELERNNISQTMDPITCPYTIDGFKCMLKSGHEGWCVSFTVKEIE